MSGKQDEAMRILLQRAAHLEDAVQAAFRYREEAEERLVYAIERIEDLSVMLTSVKLGIKVLEKD